MKYYVDTNIWRDYYENREDKFRPLGEWAFRFFKKVADNGHNIIYSNLLINELSKYFNQEKIKEIMEVVPSNLLVKVKIIKFHLRKASKIAKREKIPFGDALHYVLAKNYNAILVSRDKHFENFKGRINKPEELI